MQKVGLRSDFGVFVLNHIHIYVRKQIHWALGCHFHRQKFKYFHSLCYWTMNIFAFIIFSLSHHNFVYICLLSNSYTLKLVETWRNLLFRNRCSIRWWYRRRWQYHTVFICSNVRHIIHVASLILVLLAFVCAWEWRWMSTYKWLFKWTVYQHHTQYNFRKCVLFYALHTVTNAWFCFALLCFVREFFICVSHP